MLTKNQERYLDYKETIKEYYEQNKEEINEKQKDYYKSNKRDRIIYQKQYTNNLSHSSKHKKQIALKKEIKMNEQIQRNKEKLVMTL